MYTNCYYYKEDNDGYCKIPWCVKFVESGANCEKCNNYITKNKVDKLVNEYFLKLQNKN